MRQTAAGESSELFRATNRSPSLRVLQVEHDGNPNRWMRVQEKSGGDWSPIGSIELGYGPPDIRGVCEDSQIGPWSYLRSFANGDQVKVERRLLGEQTPGGYAFSLEEKRTAIRGGDTRDTYEWTEIESWEVEAPDLG